MEFGEENRVVAEEVTWFPIAKESILVSGCYGQRGLIFPDAHSALFNKLYVNRPKERSSPPGVSREL